MVRIALIILLPLFAFGQTGQETVTGTLRVQEGGGSPTRIVSQTNSGLHNSLEPGNGLTITGDTVLNATGGGGIGFPYGDISPANGMGFNTSEDSIGRVWMPWYEPPGWPTASAVHDAYLRYDSLMAMRGSYFQGFDTVQYVKVMAPGSVDTVDNSGSLQLDFSESGGRWTHTCAYHETDEIIPGFTTSKLFKVNGSVSVAASSVLPIDAALMVYLDGGLLSQCEVQFTLEGSSSKTAATVSCFVELDCNTHTLDLRLANNSASSTNFIIDRVNFNAYHIKTLLTPE